MSDTDIYFASEDHTLASSMQGLTIEGVELTGGTYPKIVMLLSDRRRIQFDGVWHNDSTAGVAISEATE